MAKRTKKVSISKQSVQRQSKKKAIAKPKSASSKGLKLAKQKSIYTKTTAVRAPKPPSIPKRPNASKDWDPGYSKTITMYRSQPDYF